MLDLRQRGTYCNRVSLSWFSVVQCWRNPLASLESHLLICWILHGFWKWPCAPTENCIVLQLAYTRGVFRSLVRGSSRICFGPRVDRKAKVRTCTTKKHHRSLQIIKWGRKPKQETSVLKGRPAIQILCHVRIMVSTRAFRV